MTEPSSFPSMLFLYLITSWFSELLNQLAGIIVLVLIIGPIVLIYLYFIRDIYEDNEALLNDKARSALTVGACPFCGMHRAQSHSLKVGYRRHHLSKFAWMIFWFEYSISSSEFYVKLPICEECRRKYIESCEAKFPRNRLWGNPSMIVLRRKTGYLRGVKYPMETWNLKPLQSE
jgi:hypothetical protein